MSSHMATTETMRRRGEVLGYFASCVSCGYVSPTYMVRRYVGMAMAQADEARNAHNRAMHQDTQDRLT